MAQARVLFVDHARALAGAEHSLLLLLQELDRGRFVTHLATRPGRLAAAAQDCGTTVHAVPLARLRRRPTAPWRLARGALALVRVIRREGITVVHSNTMRASFYAALAAKLTRRPLVWHVRDILSRRIYVRSMCALSGAVIAVSRAAAAPLPHRESVHIIPNGVRAGDFVGHEEKAAHLRQGWGVPAGASLVGHVARLQPWKGQRDVIAAAELLKDVSNLYVALIGGDLFGDAGPYAADLAAMVRQRGLERVVLTGHQDDVPAALRALNILVHASAQEPFGRILIEAGAAGLPIVAYDDGGVGEIVRDQVTGLLVPPGKPAALAAAVRRVVAEPSLAHRLGNNAQAHIRDCFDAQKLTRRFEDVLEAVAHRG